MLDHLGYGARIELHARATVELFSQIKNNRNIHIKDIVITPYTDSHTSSEDGDWKDFILQMITFNGGTKEVFVDEDRPFTDEELKLMIYMKIGVSFEDDLRKAGVLPDFIK